MSLMDIILEQLAPYRCLGCAAEPHILCAPCAGLLSPATDRCYSCRQTSPDSLTCQACGLTSPLRRVAVVATYDGVAKQLIWSLKLSGVKQAAKVMAKSLAALTRDSNRRPVIVPVPTATGRVRQRGYDQAALLAREVSRQSRLPYRYCLARTGQSHQHGLPRQQRLTQLAGAFRVTKPAAVRQAHIILIDDVITTGATLEAAASALLAAGAERIEAIVFARP